MGDFINCIAQIATIAGVVGGGINYIVIRPFGVMIVQLKDVVQDLQRTIKESGLHGRTWINAWSVSRKARSQPIIELMVLRRRFAGEQNTKIFS